MKHISRNKLRKKKPSQTVTAIPEKLKGGVVREAGLGSADGRRGVEGWDLLFQSQQRLFARV